MANTLDPNVLDAVLRATERLAHAQSELTAAMDELVLSDRADKQMVTRRLESAFEELAAAKGALALIVDPSA